MNFSAEDSLLCHCSRVQMNGRALAAASELLQQDLNWDYVLEAAILHGVAPLFYRGLDQLAPLTDVTASVPSGIQMKLEGLYHHNLARNQRLYGVVGEVFKTFAQAGIQAIGLKEIPLARKVFPEVGLRPIGDLDVLILKEHYSQAEHCLSDLGFSPLPRHENPYLPKYAWERQFHQPVGNVWIDLHWGVLRPECSFYAKGDFDFEVARMWRGSRTLAFDDYEILEPKPEDMLFHLCMHLDGHRHTELILFCDIAELIRYYGNTLDWHYLVTLAQQYHVETSVYYSLLYTHQLLDCPLPFCLEELGPDWFKSSLAPSLITNLNKLPDALDELRHIAPPSSAVMDRSESVVKRHTAFAMRYFEEIDQLAATFSDHGAAPIIADGAPSQMIFPSQSLRPFPDIWLLIREQDRSRLHQALLACGFETEPGASVDKSVKSCILRSRDVSSGNTPLKLVIHCQHGDDLEKLFDQANRPTPSRKNLALKAMSGAWKHPENGLVARAQLWLVALTPEEMVLYLSTRASKYQHERLFRLCGLLEFFRCHRSAIDWQKVAEIAETHGLRHLAHAGLLMANALLDQPVSEDDLSWFDCADELPTVLQWARYGPASQAVFPEARELFLCLYSLASTPGLAPKLRYLAGTSSRGARASALVTCLTRTIQMGTGLLSSAFDGEGRREASGLAYWAEPEPSSQTGHE